MNSYHNRLPKYTKYNTVIQARTVIYGKNLSCICIEFFHNQKFIENSLLDSPDFAILEDLFQDFFFLSGDCGSACYEGDLTLEQLVEELESYDYKIVYSKIPLIEKEVVSQVVSFNEIEVSSKVMLSTLKTNLQRAINREEYEKAAEIRDQIIKIESGDDSPFTINFELPKSLKL